MSDYMENMPSCYTCAYITGDFYTMSGFICLETSVDHFYVDGLPEKRVCEKYRRQSGVTIREKYPNAIPAYNFLMKERGMSEEAIESWLEKDSAILN